MKTCKFGYIDGDETCLNHHDWSKSEEFECMWEFLGMCKGCNHYECMPWQTTNPSSLPTTKEDGE